MHHLKEKLNLLNTWLESNNKKIELHLIGGFAIELHGISIGRRTEDIDNTNAITDQKIIEKIHQIGDLNGEPKWFDFGASSLALPPNYRKRLEEVEGFSNISLKVLSLKDIVILKVAAYNDRSHRGIERDLTDLLSIDPSFKEIERGLDFILESSGKDLPQKFLSELKKNIDELRNYLKEVFNENK